MKLPENGKAREQVREELRDAISRSRTQSIAGRRRATRIGEPRGPPAEGGTIWPSGTS